MFLCLTVLMFASIFQTSELELICKLVFFHIPMAFVFVLSRSPCNENRVYTIGLIFEAPKSVYV
jgi:hypothetical protein